MDVQTISLNGDWQFKGYIGEDWLWRDALHPEIHDTRGWNAATVPGSVQNDLWRAGLIPDPYVEQNSLAAEWAKDRTWVYQRAFTVAPALGGSRIELVFEGVDYSARYYLNGDLLGSSQGMFLPATFEVGDQLNFAGDNRLAVVIDPAPFEQPQIGYTSRVSTQKTRMNYWWDFSPRMVHLGIWQDVFLRVTGPARFETVFFRPVLAGDLASAEVAAQVRLDRAGDDPVRVEFTLRAAGDEAVIQRASLALAPGEVEGQAVLRVEQPELWWPNGSGGQPLYEATATAWVGDALSDTRTETIGFRRIEFVQNEGAAEGALPYNLVVNGRKIYITGWNWVPLDVLYGVEQPGKRERLLRLARNAHVNLLRVWGGGLIEKEAFYRACDRMGILIWQEFIQSSSGIDNYPSEDPDFIRFLVRNAEQAVTARCNHPALAVWCGGNELHYTETSLCDDQTPALAALRDVVKRLDPGRHWVPTSPAGGVFGFGAPETEDEAARLQDVHGPWEYQGLREQYRLYNQGRSLLHSEFGVEGITNLAALNRAIAPAHQWPVSLDNPVWEHLGAWWVKERQWDAIFGPFKAIETAVRATQFMQADGLRYAVEADRRRMYQNGGSLPWQFNEPYPMAACTSAVDYFAEPKPAYYSVARAYQPLAISARFTTLAWGGESDFEAEVWVANPGTEITADRSSQVVEMDGRILLDRGARITCAGNRAAAVDAVRLPLERIKSDLFFLDTALWDAEGELLVSARYLFSKTENLAPMVNDLPRAALASRVEKAGKNWKVFLENPSDQAALWVWLEMEKADLRAPGYAYFSDNYFCLYPGEQRIISARWSSDTAEASRFIRVSGWNFSAIRI
jgi:beta-mannosidase